MNLSSHCPLPSSVSKQVYLHGLLSICVWLWKHPRDGRIKVFKKPLARDQDLSLEPPFPWDKCHEYMYIVTCLL
jgi:hypothetical protein